MKYTLFLLVLLGTCAEAIEPRSFVQKDVCWGEPLSGDSRQLARRDIPLYSVPATRGTPTGIGVIRRGAEFRRTSCDVEGTLGHLVVRSAEAPFRPGDDVWLHAYMGEGWWKVTIDGKPAEADLGFSAWDEVKAGTCLDPQCWAVVDSPVQFTEWLAVTLVGGRHGWIKAKDQ